MDACTIIARNYLAHARLLARSFAEHHPQGTFTVLLLDDLDGEVSERGEPFRVLSPFEIGLDAAEFHRMAMIYDVMELATAVKPWLLRTLLNEGASDVTYFDPDIRIYKPLNDVSDLARRHEIVLIPHVLEPMPRDERVPSETTILEAGIYNLGFIAVSSEAHAFLDWWSERLARECYLSPAESRFVDQRWVDFVPGMFNHYILRDPGCDVAHWNLWSRQLEWTGERYEVDGVPLRFYHFSGFDPERPYLLSKHQGTTPRVLLSDRPALAKLCREYADEVLSAGYREWRKKGYVYDTLPGGLAIDTRMRRLYRAALVDSERNGGSPPPNPFDPATAQQFVAWLNAPGDPVGGAKRVSRYLRAVYESRPDLQIAFPDLRRADTDRFLAWVVADGRSQENIPEQLMPNRAAVSTSNGKPPKRRLLPGINVAGYFRAELGIGEAARQLISGIEAAGIPYSTVTYEAGTSSRQEHPFEGATTTQPIYDTNVICVNADRLLPFASDMGPDFFRDRYSIGLWFWEVPKFPEVMHGAFDAVHEVWVCSDYIAEALSAETDKPIQIVPLPVRIPDEPRASRSELGLPDNYLFLFSFDFFSVFERKNPLAIVDAFRRAFAPNEGPALVIKSINGDKVGLRLEELRAACADRDDIFVIDKYVSSRQKNSYMAVCDCYVSLHRSEGFGLTMAEAMAYSKPVIATGYSGNLAFMNDENSYLVPYTLVRIPPGCDPYPEGAEWAEPEVETAAELMRRVYENPAEAAERGQHAAASIRSTCSPERAGAFIRRRMDEIRDIRATQPLRELPEHLFKRARSPRARAIAAIARRSGALRSAYSPFGLSVMLARRVLYRLLAPYVQTQHELSARLDRLERSVADLATFQHDATANLAALTSHLERIEEPLGSISNRLEPLVLGAQLMRLPANSARRSDDVYRSLEDVFRGPENEIRERQRIYIDLLRDRDPVLDIGCGRGELLELLREAGIEGHGLDPDPGMVSRCREKGLDVEQTDAVAFLESQRDESFGAIFSAQVIEHLQYDYLLNLLKLARDKLREGGLFVAETVNPHSIIALRAFWLDPTHRAPIYPEVAIALLRMHGFSSESIIFPTGTGDPQLDRREQGDYAVLATKAESG